MEKNDWKCRVKESICGRWKDLCIFKDDNLDDILNNLYKEYEPQNDGEWSAAPKWTEIFNWTSCPLDHVRAVILLMEPIEPGKTYESIGYSLGIKQKSTENNEIYCSAVLKFFKILDEFFKSNVDEKKMKEVVKEGFNPKELSEKGILFLNVSLTRGKDKNIDIFRDWLKFTFSVLKEVSHKSQFVKVPLFQLYNSEELENKIKEQFIENDYYVVRPPFMDSNGGGNHHLSYFRQNEIYNYASEIYKVIEETEISKDELNKKNKNYDDKISKEFEMISVDNSKDTDNLKENKLKFELEELQALHSIYESKVKNSVHNILNDVIQDLKECFNNKFLNQSTFPASI